MLQDVQTYLQSAQCVTFYYLRSDKVLQYLYHRTSEKPFSVSTCRLVFIDIAGTAKGVSLGVGYVSTCCWVHIAVSLNAILSLVGHCFNFSEFLTCQRGTTVIGYLHGD